MPPRVFAFDLVLENVRELSEKYHVHAVDFKLLDFSTVSVVLKPARKTREKSTKDTGKCPFTLPGSHGPKTSRKSFCKGKSVVFEMDPEELLCELKRIPLKISVRKANSSCNDTPKNNKELSNDPLKLGVSLTNGGLIDLSKTAESMEKVFVEHQQLPKSQTINSSWRYHGRDTIVSVGGEIRVCVKYSLVCVGDDNNNGDGYGSGNRGIEKDVCEKTLQQKGKSNDVLEKKEVVERDEIRQQELTEKELNFQCQSQEERRHSLSDSKPDSEVASCIKDGSNLKDSQSLTTERTSIPPTINPNTITTGRGIHSEVSPHTALSRETTSSVVDGVDYSVKETQMYIPNSVCPPPLYYHSTQEGSKNETIHSSTQANPRHSATQCGSIGHNVQQGYVDWSMLAEYDQTNCPITTHLKTQKADPTNVTSLLMNHSTTTPLKCLPLLSALVEELVQIASDRGTSKEKIETISTRSQTENLTVAQTRSVKTNPAKIRRVRKPTMTGGCGSGGRFVRECCPVKKPTKKLVPSNKSVLYPPDIPHKQKQYLSQKLGRKAVSFDRVTPLKTESQQTKVIVKKQKLPKSVQVGKKKETSKFSTNGVNLKRTDDTKQPHFVKKLDVFIPTQPPSTLSSPCSTPDDQNSFTSSTITTVHRDTNKISVETQTTEEERDSLALVPLSPLESLGLIEKSVQTLDCELVQELQSDSDETSGEKHSRMQVIPLEDPNEASKSVSLSPQLAPKFSNVIHMIKEPEERSNAAGAALSETSHESTTPPSVYRNKLQSRHTDMQSPGVGELRLSKEKFASTSDVRSHLPESPLLRSTIMKGSLSSLHEAGLKQADSAIPENTLQLNANRDDSVMYDSFMSTEMLSSATGAKSILPRHCREGVVYLASSQGSLASEPCKQGTSARDEDGLMEGETGEAVDNQSGEYSDDFENSDCSVESRTTECTHSTSSSVHTP